MGPALILLYALSLLAAAALGREAEAGRALLEGAQAALPFALQLAGGLCLWSGVTELLERAGASAPNLVLVEGRRGGHPGLTIEPPLLLRDADGSDSAELRRICRR